MTTEREKVKSLLERVHDNEQFISNGFQVKETLLNHAWINLWYSVILEDINLDLAKLENTVGSCGKISGTDLLVHKTKFNGVRKVSEEFLIKLIGLLTILEDTETIADLVITNVELKDISKSSLSKAIGIHQRYLIDINEKIADTDKLLNKLGLKFKSLESVLASGRSNMSSNQRSIFTDDLGPTLQQLIIDLNSCSTFDFEVSYLINGEDKYFNWGNQSPTFENLDKLANFIDGLLKGLNNNGLLTKFKCETYHADSTKDRVMIINNYYFNSLVKDFNRVFNVIVYRDNYQIINSLLKNLIGLLQNNLFRYNFKDMSELDGSILRTYLKAHLSLFRRDSWIRIQDKKIDHARIAKAYMKIRGTAHLYVKDNSAKVPGGWADPITLINYIHEKYGYPYFTNDNRILFSKDKKKIV